MTASEHTSSPPADAIPEPPLVRGVPILGSALAFGRDAPAFLTDCRRRHGDVFTITVAGQRMTFVLDPHSHAAVLKLQGDLSFHELAHEISARAFGHQLLSGERATSMERVTAAHLKGPALAVLTDRAQQRLDAWLRDVRVDRDRPVGLYNFVRRAYAIRKDDLVCLFPWPASTGRAGPNRSRTTGSASRTSRRCGSRRTSRISRTSARLPERHRIGA
jgi:hypothetical protein